MVRYFQSKVLYNITLVLNDENTTLTEKVVVVELSSQEWKVDKHPLAPASQDY